MKTLNEQIIPVYCELRKELMAKARQLLESGYSNIFCIGVPKNWESAPIRVMIVGEEARWGTYDEDLDFESGSFRRIFSRFMI